MNLHSFWSTVSRRSTTVLVVLIIGLLVMPAALRYFKPMYSATAKVLLVNEQSQRDPLVQSKDLTTLATSSTVLQSVRSQLGLSDDISALRSQLRVLVVVDSNVMSIIFRSPSPAFSVKAANAVADAVVSTYHTISSQQYGGLTSRLRLDLAAQQANIQQIDRAYQRAVAHGASTGDDQSLDLVAGQVATLQAQRNAAYATLASDVAQAEGGSAPSTGVDGTIAPQAVAQDPEYRQLVEATGADAARLALLRSRYSKDYPGMPGLSDQVRRESRSVRDARQRVLSSEIADDRTRLNILDQEVASEQGQLVDSAQAGVSANVLRAQRDAAEGAYQTLSTSLGQALANEAEASSLGSAVVIDRAVPVSSVLSSLPVRITIGLLFVLGLALSAAFAMDALDPRLDTGKQIEKVYGRPILASLRNQ